MADATFHVPLVFVYAATLFWATSGAVVGIQRRFDAVGVFVVALLSSTGGGLMRDAICLHRTPVLLTEPALLPLIVGTTAVLTLFTKPLTRLLSHQNAQGLVDVIDAAGIPVFAILGMQLAAEEGIPVFGILFVGVVNGVGGGLLRDVVAREVPALLRPGHFTTLFLVIACALFLVLTRRFGVRPFDAGWLTATTFFVLRILAVHRNWRSRSVGVDEDRDRADPAVAGR